MLRRILIVEDQVIIAADLGQIVNQIDNCIAVIAKSAAEALTSAKQQRFDLALMDIALGGDKDGVAVAGELRAEFGIPSIFVSAYLDAQTIERATAVKPLGYIQKPYSAEDIRQAIIDAFDNGNNGAGHDSRACNGD